MSLAQYLAHNVLQRMRILDHPPAHATAHDMAWLRQTVPFLLFGQHNVRLFHVPFATRRQLFVTLGRAVWLTHLCLVAAGDITLEESRAVRQVLEDYLVDHAY